MLGLARVANCTYVMSGRCCWQYICYIWTLLLTVHLLCLDVVADSTSVMSGRCCWQYICYVWTLFFDIHLWQSVLSICMTSTRLIQNATTSFIKNRTNSKNGKPERPWSIYIHIIYTIIGKVTSEHLGQGGHHKYSNGKIGIVAYYYSCLTISFFIYFLI